MGTNLSHSAIKGGLGEYSFFIDLLDKNEAKMQQYYIWEPFIAKIE